MATLNVERLVDEWELTRAVDALDRAVDSKDWARARSFFADDLSVSLGGVDPAPMPADDLVGGWADNLKGSKSSMHLRGNHAVALDGDSANVTSAAYAWNRMEGGEGDPLWEVWGDYVHSFVRTRDGWKINAFSFLPTHERGSQWVKETPGR